MGLHAEARLDRKFVEFARLLNVYLNHSVSPGSTAMPIIRYRQYTDALVSRTLRLPSGERHEPRGTELATLADGYTYVSLPEDAALPAEQPEEIADSVEAVTLSPEQVSAIKAASPHVRLINARVREKIASRYSVADELKLLRTAPSAEAETYNSWAEECRAWGRERKAALGL